MSYNVIDITQKLVQFPSVTPKDEGAQYYLAELLTGMGFECHHLPFGEGEERIENLFARIGRKGPHICFAGHTDVVPPGPETQWTHPPFAAEIHDGILYGRGVADMKGSVAAYVAAIHDYLEKHDTPAGSISLLITGDEEAEAIYGTAPVLEWMKENGHTPDVCLVGEPSNPREMGEEIKIGRRGSLTGQLTVHGKQGHVAYPHRAENPIPRLAKMVDALASYEFDQGTEFFTPTNLEVTTIDVGNQATNVIPASGSAVFNIRFNDSWSNETLQAKVREILDSVCDSYELDLVCSGESFLTEPGEWTEIVKQAVEDVVGRTPEYSTKGGTSDARFVTKYCPVVEFGPINQTIHQIDEHLSVDVLEKTTKTYERILGLYFKTA